MVHIIERYRNALEASGIGVDTLFQYGVLDWEKLRVRVGNSRTPLHVLLNPEMEGHTWAYSGPLQDQETIALAATIRAKVSLEKYARGEAFQKIFEPTTPEELATMRGATHEFIQEMGSVARIRKSIEDKMREGEGIIEDERILTDEERVYYESLREDGMQLGPYTAARCALQVIRKHKDGDASIRLGALIGQVFYTEFFDKAKDAVSS